jgi:proteasome lid subunit RPN8/RPN11
LTADTALATFEVMIRYSVTISPRILAGLRREAGATAPAECCGALIGVTHDDSIEIRMMIPVTNVAHDHTAFRIDAPTVLRLERQAVCAGVQVVGFYHSHPTTTAEPSAADLENAVPGYVHLIVDVPRSRVRCWRLRDDRSGFHELDVALLAGAA